GWQSTTATTTATALPARDRRRCGRTVQLRAGETLAEIARECGTTVNALLRANAEIDNVRDIPAGKRIVVPPYPSRRASLGCGDQTFVRAGENIARVAERCGVTEGALYDANPTLALQDSVAAGRTLRLPPYASPLVARRCNGPVVIGRTRGTFDTLAAVAERCGTTVDALLTVNPSINNVREIRSGTKIALPRIAAPLERRCGTHEVARRGDTVATIAKRCGVTVGGLFDYNARLAAGRLAPGRVVDIPPTTIPAL
ncbi:MAG: LysM peptidoglycan-binding domain-containing protein, partial [Pseudomonadota bacterium]